MYKGHQATLLRIFPYAALNYACFEQYKRVSARRDRDEASSTAWRNRHGAHSLLPLCVSALSSC